MFLFLVAANYSLVVLRKNLLYKSKDNMFPSLPVSTLYGTIIETLFDDVFRFAVFTDQLLLNIRKSIFTMSM